MRKKKQIGQTKDVGFQFGLRKSYLIPSDFAWDFMFSKKGLDIWLGEIDTEIALNKSFITKDGIEGLVRVFKPNSHIRLNWKSKDWENITTLQVRVIGNHQKATISFHQEKLLNSEQRDEMKVYWNRIMRLITAEIEKASG